MSTHNTSQIVVPGSSYAERAWWKEAVIYQVYPNSYADSNADGIGDLNGIASKLDYLKSLGVDVLWLSPIYASPQADMGYDISDYRAIHKDYGTMEDWEKLLAGLHERGMKLMMDLVVNHTSSEHEWFKESRSSKTNPKRDWYFWRPAKYDADGNRQPPNNWMASFRGGPAWSWDEKTEEYYMRIYTESQPDLNWDNPEVRQAVWDLMKFWLDKGADGFRMDVINLISKVPGLPDVSVIEPGYLQPPYENTANGPNVHKYLQEMHREVLSKYKTVNVGETPFTHDVRVLSQYTLPQNNELQMVFTFELHDIDGEEVSPLKPRQWKLSEMKSILNKYQTKMWEEGGWNSLYLENHDQARSVSRFGNDSPEWRAVSAKMLALMHCGLSGTVYVYQGEEIGTKNLPKSWPVENYPDVATHTYWNEVLESRRKQTGTRDPDMSDVLVGIQHKARDNARAPMQWDDSPNAGFTTGTPWMKHNDDFKEWNVAAQLKKTDSVWAFWKGVLAFRKANLACTYGRFQLYFPDDPKLFCYAKIHETQSILVVTNFSTEPLSSTMPSEIKGLQGASVVTSNYAESVGNIFSGSSLELKPYEGRVYLLK